MLKEFKEFAMRGNVMDMAVGIVIGAAFGTIVKSLVADVIMPPIGYIFGGLDFTNLFITLGPEEYATLAEAQEAGAATINIGLFINATNGSISKELTRASPLMSASSSASTWSTASCRSATARTTTPPRPTSGRWSNRS